MTFTCLINNYNYGAFAPEAVASALRQTQPFDEIIVIDDGSTDGSVEALDKISAQESRVRVVQKANGGQLSCFNEGLALAQGDLVFFLDSDDRYEPGYVQRMSELYRRRPDIDFACCGRRVFGGAQGVELQHPTSRDLGFSAAITWLKRTWVGGSTSCISARRPMLDRCFPLPQEESWRVCADLCLVYGTSLAGARKYYVAEPLVNYRVHGANHYFGRETDPLANYRHQLAMHVLFEHLRKKFGYDGDRLAELLPYEFRTVERPTPGLYRQYRQAALAGPGPWSKRLSRFAKLTTHYLKARRALTDFPQPLRVAPATLQPPANPPSPVVPVAAQLAG